MRYTSGWVKAHRKVLEKSWISDNLVALGLWQKLLFMANYESSEVMFNGKLVTLKRGQLVTSLSELKGKTACNRSVIERLLNLMVEGGMLQQQNSNGGRILTICNYDKYQCYEIVDQQQNNNGATTEQQHNNNGTAYSNKLITKEPKKRKEKKSLYTLKSEGHSELIPDDVLSLADNWLEFARKQMPWKAEDPKWTRQGFGKELLRICKTMNMPSEGLSMVLEYVKKDDFWMKNAVSPFGLLKKSSRNDLRKIDNIVSRMKTKQDRTREAVSDWVKESMEAEARGESTGIF